MIIRPFESAQRMPAAYLRDLLANNFLLRHGLAPGALEIEMGQLNLLVAGGVPKRCGYYYHEISVFAL